MAKMDGRCTPVSDTTDLRAKLKELAEKCAAHARQAVEKYEAEHGEIDLADRFIRRPKTKEQKTRREVASAKYMLVTKGMWRRKR